MIIPRWRGLGGSKDPEPFLQPMGCSNCTWPQGLMEGLEYTSWKRSIEGGSTYVVKGTHCSHWLKTFQYGCSEVTHTLVYKPSSALFRRSSVPWGNSGGLILRFITESLEVEGRCCKCLPEVENSTSKPPAFD